MSGVGNLTVLSDEEYYDTIGCLNRLKVPQVKDIARCLSLPLSGKKQDLIDRVVAYFEQGKRFNDNIRLLAVRTIVLKVRNNDPIPNFTALYDALRTGAYNFVEGISQYSNYKIQLSSSPSQTKTNNESHTYKGHVLYFKESPFYKLKRLVHGSPQIALPSKMKSICRYHFILNEVENKLLKLGDEKLRFYLLCGVSNHSTASTSSALLQFPIPIEIHVNGTHIKENVRGIKGKPGTARPANVTPYILPDEQLNKIEMAFAGTTESFLLYLYIVEYVSCEEIIQTIMQQPHVHKNSTILEIKKEYSNDDGEDDDIIVSTSSISLKCPLTYSRMKYPTKSIYCQHIQCFDGLSYLQLQEQVPNWICPVCSNKMDISHLAISDYYCDILEKTNDEVENVTINEDGTWEAIYETSNTGVNNNKSKTGINPLKENDSIEIKRSPQSRILSEETQDRTPSTQPETIEIITLDSDTEDENTEMNELSGGQNYSSTTTTKNRDMNPFSNISVLSNMPNRTILQNQESAANNIEQNRLNIHADQGDSISQLHVSQNEANRQLHRPATVQRIENKNYSQFLPVNESNESISNTHNKINDQNQFINNRKERNNNGIEGNTSVSTYQNNSETTSNINELLTNNRPLSNMSQLSQPQRNAQTSDAQASKSPSIDEKAIYIPHMPELENNSANNRLIGDQETLVVTSALPQQALLNSSAPDRAPTRQSLTSLIGQHEFQTPSKNRSTSAPIPILPSLNENNIRENNKISSDSSAIRFQSNLQPLQRNLADMNSSQIPGTLPNIRQLESQLCSRENGEHQLLPLSRPDTYQDVHQEASIKNIYESHHEKQDESSDKTSQTRYSIRKSPLFFFGRDSLANIYQRQQPSLRESAQQTGNLNLGDYQINQFQSPQRDTSMNPTSYDAYINDDGPHQRQGQPIYPYNTVVQRNHTHQTDENQLNDSNGADDLTESGHNKSMQSPIGRSDTNSVLNESNSLRYSQSAFDLVNKNFLRNDDPEKHQGIVGLLGIVLSENSMHINQSSTQTPQRSEVTPLKGKIDSMRLGTHSDKKRSLSGSGSGSNRTWNKRLNSSGNTDANEPTVSNHDSTPSKPVYGSLHNQQSQDD